MMPECHFLGNYPLKGSSSDPGQCRVLSCNTASTPLEEARHS